MKIKQRVNIPYPPSSHLHRVAISIAKKCHECILNDDMKKNSLQQAIVASEAFRNIVTFQAVKRLKHDRSLLRPLPSRNRTKISHGRRHAGFKAPDTTVMARIYVHFFRKMTLAMMIRLRANFACMHKQTTTWAVPACSRHQQLAILQHGRGGLHE